MPAKAAAAPKVEKAGTFRVLLVTIGVFPVVWVMLPTLVLLAIVIAPTVAMLFVRSRDPTSWLTMLGFNFTGALPAVFDLWYNLHRIDTVWLILMRPSTLILAWSLAFFGLGAYKCVPPVVAVFVSLAARQKVASLEGQRKRLVEKWGPEVESA
ncbi:hypothetical protein FACS1894186_0530 [Alphaproteobacteria bacterium]|nr:hypothetical protein FACS1894186_0530 [Alphaproteobacteria bacterium]